MKLLGNYLCGKFVQPVVTVISIIFVGSANKNVKCLFDPFSLLCSTKQFHKKCCLLFCDFLVPILNGVLYFSYQEGHSALVQIKQTDKPDKAMV